MCRYGAAFHGATHARRDTFHCLLHSSRPFLSSLVFLARSPANNRPWRNGVGHRGPYPATFFALFPISVLPFPSMLPFFLVLLPVLAFPFFSLHSVLLPLLFVFFRRYTRLCASSCSSLFLLFALLVLRSSRSKAFIPAIFAKSLPSNWLSSRPLFSAI